MRISLFILLLSALVAACQSQAHRENDVEPPSATIDAAPSTTILPGAYQTNEYLPLLEGKNVAMVVNHTSLIDSTHLVDSLLASGVAVKQIFAPEHGFRGEAGAGDLIKDGTDLTTGLPIFSLHGKHRKPTPEQLKNIDVVIFDIQDVGARFYTYISTMHYVMEACAEQGKAMLILDRPNPNGFYIGPVREPGLAVVSGDASYPHRTRPNGGRTSRDDQRRRLAP